MMNRLSVCVSHLFEASNVFQDRVTLLQKIVPTDNNRQCCEEVKRERDGKDDDD